MKKWQVSRVLDGLRAKERYLGRLRTARESVRGDIQVHFTKEPSVYFDNDFPEFAKLIRGALDGEIARIEGLIKRTERRIAGWK